MTKPPRNALADVQSMLDAIYDSWEKYDDKVHVYNLLTVQEDLGRIIRDIINSHES